MSPSLTASSPDCEGHWAEQTPRKDPPWLNGKHAPKMTSSRPGGSVAPASDDLIFMSGPAPSPELPTCTRYSRWGFQLSYLTGILNTTCPRKNPDVQTLTQGFLSELKGFSLHPVALAKGTEILPYFVLPLPPVSNSSPNHPSLPLQVDSTPPSRLPQLPPCCAEPGVLRPPSSCLKPPLASRLA